ncbi:non-ribosomal peptide synthetase [Microbulbifer sp. GL-2]|uniref:non-ribosomal peptide synthetase n=1 Tax=Microbulbifer sp. GL-2 TaxID=2591606 RepID=UPI001164153F|nr:non-ribosomal peptide synthetase [Microbulbifer sp. GL-2]BBM03197.1 plipastatin synthase subunit C [Microbulbifer sp. GL-2]
MSKYFVHKKFSETARKFPNNIAILESQREITYQNLNAYSNQLAHYIGENLRKNGSSIGLFLPKGIEYILGVLAILKNDQAFLPLSPQLPGERLKDILEKSQLEIILTSSSMASQLKRTLEEIDCSNIHIVVFDYKNDLGAIAKAGDNKEVNLLSAYSKSDPLQQAIPEDNCYIMFTSGTTGNPKAIVGNHKSLSHFMHWEISEFSSEHQHRVAQLAPSTFDVSLRDIFLPLLTGGVCCIPDNDVQMDARRLLEWIISQRISLIHCVPSIFRLLTTEVEVTIQSKDSLKHLEYILLAGEPLLGRDVNHWFSVAGSNTSLVNLYGPSETTLAKLYYRIETGVYEPNRVLPVGKPIPNTAVLILKGTKLCRIGEIGEIYIKTPFRSKGYLNDPSLTQANFIQNPLNQGEEDVIYKTGDLGRYQADHTVEVLGRLDRQVKINGIRIELNDIEGHILDIPELDQCFLSIFKDDNQSNLLVCYYTCHNDISTEEIKSLLAPKLSNNFIPSIMIKLDKFPLMLNGKIDKKSLPNPSGYLTEFEACDEQELSLFELKLSEIWRANLGLPKVSIHQKYFDLGGTSLTAMKTLGEVYRELDVEVSILEFYQNDTISRLASYIDQMLIASNKSYQTIPVAPKQKSYPLSRQQQSIWLNETLAEQSGAYAIPGACKLKGNLDLQAFNKAIEALIERYDILRTIIDYTADKPVQTIQSHLKNPLKVVNLTHEVEPDKRAQALIAEDCKLAFTLSEPPLFRLKLFRLDEHEFYFYYCFHHLICDAWSLGIFGQQLMSAYSSIMSGNNYCPESTMAQYHDFCCWQTLPQQREKQEINKAYWMNRFSRPAPALRLPTDFARPSERRFLGNQEQFILDVDLSKNLKEMCTKKGIGLFPLLMSIYQVLLAKYSSERDIVVGFPTAGREHPDLDSLLGMFVNTLPLRSDCDSDIRFHEFLKRTISNINEAISHQSYGLENLIRDLDIKRDMSRSPIFDTLLVFQNFSQPELDSHELKFSNLDVKQRTAWYDLILNWMEVDGKLRCNVLYDTDLFRRETIVRLGQHFTLIAQQILKDPDCLIGEISLLNNQEIQQFAHDFDQACKPAKYTSLHRGFEYWAQVESNSLALIYKEERFTYDELNQEANQLANYLLEQGVVPGSIVGIHLSRSPLMIKSILAVLKIGAIYVPIDLQYPQVRKDYMLSDSKVSHILSTSSSKINSLSGVKCLQLDLVKLGRYKTDNLISGPSSKSLAYIIYTSGSTGKPKGTLGHHEGVVNTAHGFGEYLSLAPGERVSQFANSSFDGSVFEIFVTLLNGATLVIVNDETIQDIDEFENYVTKTAITMAFMPPTYVRQLHPERLSSLNTLMTWGSPTDFTLAETWSERLRYINAYGPTEVSAVSSAFDISAIPLKVLKETYKSIPIGKPIANLRMDVLDENHNIQPVGIPGELCISGIGVGRGYLNREEQTTRCFKKNPNAPELDMYRTGDLVCRLPDGNIEFLGRIDDQVKIRGYRIEPTEIEYQLQQLDQVLDARVLVNGEPSNQYLTAYYIGVVGDESAIRQSLSTQLPQYMMPSTFVALDKFPMTPNDKVDKSALRQLSASQIQDGIGLQSEDSIEEAIATVWKNLLGVDYISAGQSFVELGGDSIKAIQTVAKLKKFGLKVKASHVLQYPTIEQLKIYVSPVVEKDNVFVQGQLPLTPIQHWFFRDYNGDKHKCFQHALLNFSNKIDQKAMQQAMGELMLHHDGLRSTFIYDPENEQWQQEILANEIPANLHSISVNKADLESMSAHMNVLANQSWLNKSPLLQGVIFKSKVGDDKIFLIAHHLIVDTVSWWILIEDLEKAYEQIICGQKVNLGGKTSSLQLWSHRLIEFSKSNSLQDEFEFWSQTEQLLLSSFKLPKSTLGTGNDKISYTLSKPQTREMLEKNSKQGISVNELLLTLHARSMTKIFGPNKYAVTLENHGREDCFEDLDVSRTIGWFTSLFPFVISQDNQSCPLVEDIIKTKINMRKVPNKGLGYGVLRYLSSCESTERSFGIIRPQVSFNYYGFLDRNSEKNRVLDVSDFDLPDLCPALQHEMEISGAISDGRLHIELKYDKKYLTSDMAQQWIEHLTRELTDYTYLEGEVNSAELRRTLEPNLKKGIKEILKRYHIPGLVLGARFPDGTTAVACQGVANSQTEEKLTKDHQFRIGSLSKTFVATLILQLVDEGRIFLDQAIWDILPPGVLSGSGISKQITIRQLLNHTSGLQDYMKDDNFRDCQQKQPGKTWQPEELLSYFNAETSSFGPESDGQWLYSSSGYILLGLIIEQVTGEKFEHQLSSRITQPLGLNNTHLQGFEVYNENLATGHNDELSPLSESCISFVWAAGGLISTVEDMLVWQDAFISGKLLSQEMQEQRFDLKELPDHVSLEQDIQAGLGVFNLEGRLGHIGDLLGHEAAMLANNDIQLIVLLNGETKHPAMVYSGSVFEAASELF